MHAFLETIDHLELSAVTNLIALGDSHMELDAAQHLGTKFSTSLIKTIKFWENPTPDEIIKQLNLVLVKLEQIFTSPKNLTIRLEWKKEEENK